MLKTKFSPRVDLSGFGNKLFNCASILPMAEYYTAQLWQKEASDIPSKSELLMCLYFTHCALHLGQILCINTHPAKIYVR